MNITLVKYTSDDFDLFKPLLLDDEIMKYITGKGWTEVQVKEKFEAIIEVNRNEDDLGYFKVFDNGNLYIGYCKLAYSSNDCNVLEIGYVINKEFWGKGYGCAVGQAVIDTANRLFPQLDIIGIIDPHNLASKKILEKLGFKTYFKGFEEGLPTEKLMLKRLH
ncbi:MULTISPECIES: GNAT family N-acetyltransferase [unclassified Sphingobacterium]|jgi:ribosomal-protein-alanine N-acetyltransferase|uniref:GNAT family N-acetyltransferase n=1 Tax=unclassified Sphingobacterium TaxID=2609468 RepID=UPI0014387608|nr:GNAT family N-acetyltransferase [Sphingobacterium sp. B16(2022)]NJI72137.1 GNAT family N-acetyltransferase [Sphingobacterium sp. B16(2022)]